MASVFEISSGYEKNMPVIRLSGEITAEAEEDLVQTYEAIPSERRAKVVLDFNSTRYINSSGIAVLISLITRASDSGQKVEFCGLNPHFRKVMDIVGLTDFVQIHETLADALRP